MNILKSKKSQAAAVGLVVALAGKIGLDLDETSLLTILSPILAYIAGQSAADIGKEKAIIEHFAVLGKSQNGDSSID